MVGMMLATSKALTSPEAPNSLALINSRSIPSRRLVMLPAEIIPAARASAVKGVRLGSTGPEVLASCVMAAKPLHNGLDEISGGSTLSERD